MGRYIDADALKQKKVYCSERHENVVPVAEIDWQPTADVVPKSEVEELLGKYEDLKLKYADLQKDKDELIAWVNDKKIEVAREIFEEIEFEIHQLDFDREETRAIAIEGIIANAKKKYTESE